MFRYLARRHDRTHILKSLERQQRIGDATIEFGLDAELAFSDYASKEKYENVDECPGSAPMAQN